MKKAMALPLALALLAVLSGESARPGEDETAGFLPKDDLGVARFLEKMPLADGRGVLVAVLDTGVDLLHPSLEKTSDGKRKIVDFFDGTDAGEVDTTFSAEIAEGGVIGLSGRHLRLGPIAVETVRLGVVRAGDIYPRGLKRRLAGERKKDRERSWRLDRDRAVGGKSPDRAPDAGDPVHDLVLYRVGEEWRVRVDTDSDGDLAEEADLREFGASGDVGVLAGRARLGFGVRVLAEGKAVSLLFDGGGHGTHVAGIIAGYHGEGSPLNGLAPGAQILAVKIGNGRYGGSTTHHALIQGLEWAGRAGADVVNISFGGPTLFADGREICARFIDEAVAKYGYAVCLSAGNSGPTLSTVGAPATSRRAYSIGAWCPPETMTSNYGILEPRGGSLFGFSSLGPLPGGATGVDFIAPGAAVSAVPEWSLVAGRNMNGTSMAAPQAAGALAVLVSAAKSEKIPVTSNRILSAMREGARPVAGLTAVEQGYGLIDVNGALEALRRMGDAETTAWRVGGFFRREFVDDRPVAIRTRITPDLPKSLPARNRARFARMLRLVPDQEWLSVASPVHASADGAEIHARATPARMKEGLNVGLIRAIDIETGREAARIPVTLIRPRVLRRCGSWTWETATLSAGDRRSLFVLVPPGATRVRVEARETNPEGGTRIAFGTRLPTVRVKSGPLAAEMSPGRATILHDDVREGTTLEVVIHRPFRAPPGESEVEVGLSFKGLVPGVEEIVIPRGRMGTHLNLRAGGEVRGRFEARVEWIEAPFALDWKTAKSPHAPALLGEETLFVHTGSAEFDVSAKKEELRFDLGFETPFEDYLDDAVWRILDGNGKVASKGHVWRGPFGFRPPHRGRFTLEVVIWERGRRFFREGAMFSPVRLTKTKPRTLAVKHDVYDGALPGGPSGRNFALSRGERTSALFLRPKGTETLRGTVRFIDDEWGTALLSLRLRVLPAKDEPVEVRLRRELTEHLALRLRHALDSDRVDPAEVTKLRGLAEVARTAGCMKPEWEPALHLLSARTGAEAARIALTALDEMVDGAKGDAVQPARRARCEAAVLVGDMEKAKGDFGQLRNDEATRYARFVYSRAAGDEKAALDALSKLKKSAPPRPDLARAEIELLAASGKTARARRLLESYTGRFPGTAADVAGLAIRIEAANGREEER